MRFRALSLLAGVAVLALTAGGVLASVDTMDQHQDTSNSPFGWDAGDNSTAQTFTAGLSGQLDRVSLYGLTGDLSAFSNVQLRDGGPTGTLLATATVVTPTGVEPTWFDAAFSPAAHVDAGHAYAIVFGSGSNVWIGGTCEALYANGEALVYWSNFWQVISTTGHFESCIKDFAFRTYVVPAVIAPPTVAMAFGAASIPVGGTTSLTFTITNPNVVVPTVTPALLATATLTNIGFTDTLPAGLSIATPNNVGGGCGGSITAAAGTNLVSITGLTLAAGATCGFGVDVIGTTVGTKNNATTAVTSSEAGTGNSASASVVVAAATPAPTPTPAPTAAPTPVPTTVVQGATAAPTRALTPPPTSTVDDHGSGSDAPPLPLLALTGIAGLLMTGLLLRPETRVRRQ